MLETEKGASLGTTTGNSNSAESWDESSEENSQLKGLSQVGVIEIGRWFRCLFWPALVVLLLLYCWPCISQSLCYWPSPNTRHWQSQEPTCYRVLSLLPSLLNSGKSSSKKIKLKEWQWETVASTCLLLNSYLCLSFSTVPKDNFSRNKNDHLDLEPYVIWFDC